MYSAFKYKNITWDAERPVNGKYYNRGSTTLLYWDLHSTSFLRYYTVDIVKNEYYDRSFGHGSSVCGVWHNYDVYTGLIPYFNKLDKENEKKLRQLFKFINYTRAGWSSTEWYRTWEKIQDYVECNMNILYFWNLVWVAKNMGQTISPYDMPYLVQWRQTDKGELVCIDPFFDYGLLVYLQELDKKQRQIDYGE